MSIRLTKFKAAALVLGVGVILAAIVLLIPSGTGGSQAVDAVKVQSGAVKTNDDRLAYIEKFGWTVESEPVEVQEIIVPSEKDDGVFKAYNEIQKAQGFDLSKLSGKRIKRWTYRVTNYPGQSRDEIHASIYIYNNKVVGGDVASIALDGFMHGLDKFS